MTLRFTKTHEWIDDSGKVGITDHAQSQLGDVVFVELPQVGARLTAGQKFGTIESVKAASDLYAPVSGVVAEVNEGIASAPETVNKDAQGSGWMVRLTQVDESGTNLMSEDAYRQTVGH
jgi:glycine cleavage system H protein